MYAVHRADVFGARAKWQIFCVCQNASRTKFMASEFSAPRVYKQAGQASTPEKSCSSHGKCIFGWNMDACSITYNMNSMRTLWLCVLNQPTPYKLINKCNILFVLSTLDFMWFGNIPPRCSKRSVKLPISNHRRWYPHLMLLPFSPPARCCY